MKLQVIRERDSLVFFFPAIRQKVTSDQGFTYPDRRVTDFLTSIIQVNAYFDNEGVFDSVGQFETRDQQFAEIDFGFKLTHDDGIKDLERFTSQLIYRLNQVAITFRRATRYEKETKLLPSKIISKVDWKEGVRN